MTCKCTMNRKTEFLPGCGGRVDRGQTSAQTCEVMTISMACAVNGKVVTYKALVHMTAMLSDSHRGRFGDITNARLTGVIFVASCVRASRNSCRKLTTNSTTRRHTLGRRRTISTHASGTCAHNTHASYISAGTNGSRSSRRQSLSRLAETCRSSISPESALPTVETDAERIDGVAVTWNTEDVLGS
jgi:hypothetical protein